MKLGKLPSGGDLVINRMAAQADLLVAEGFIEPHFFAGFSGGRKSVLPGIASRQTVIYNHNAAFINDPHARTGILENNPIHRAMLYAARAAKLAFICNVVINSEKEVIYVSDAAEEIVQDLHMIPAHSIEEAIGIADEILAGKGIWEAKILAIPDGVSVIVN